MIKQLMITLIALVFSANGLMAEEAAVETPAGVNPPAEQQQAAPGQPQANAPTAERAPARKKHKKKHRRHHRRHH